MISQSVPFLSKARPNQRLLTGRSSSVSRLGRASAALKRKDLVGRNGLPLIGETVSFLANRQDN